MHGELNADEHVTLGQLWSSGGRSSHSTRLRRRLRYEVRRLRLSLISHFSRKAVVGDGPVVCLTSYGNRVQSAWLTIESVGAGTTRPSRLILWLDFSFASAQLPPAIERLRRRGLEVAFSPDYRSHKKWYPYVVSVRDSPTADPFVIADDDVLYPRWWLTAFAAAHEKWPNDILAFRSHVISLDALGLRPYLSWTPNYSLDARLRHFSTGVSGVLYPPKMTQILGTFDDDFMRLAPFADDVWLHSIAVKNDVRTRQVLDEPLEFVEVRGTATGGLASSNSHLGGNDAQIARVYDATIVAALLTERISDDGAQ